jgi:ABC-type nickel/cobalt efflux system permease component RcnA
MQETLSSISTFAVLGVGLLFGLKHATEVDHIVAVSTIVSQHKSIRRSALVGALWGAGHTTALLITGAIVLSMQIAIPESVSNWLEFAVALMIIGLGSSALWTAFRNRRDVHVHQHTHDGVSHVHVHFHDRATQHDRAAAIHSHAISRIGLKPMIVGTVHGLAGSGALTLLVMTQIRSSWMGFLYLAVFGLGSIAGMLLMSGLIGLPFLLTSRKLTRFHRRVQVTAAVLSICFGLWYGYQTGASHLF